MLTQKQAPNAGEEISIDEEVELTEQRDKEAELSASNLNSQNPSEVKLAIPSAAVAESPFKKSFQE